ncbi:MAG: DEAD/DEAH box helicase family protein [bacterium]|nr:DEAD/DEAH box helicase family protein [bacterium]
MRHAQIRKILATSIVKMLARNNLPFPLYGYQTETLKATIRWLNRARGPRRAYVSQATGLGKTVEYSAIVRACRKLRVLVIVPSKQLVEQSIRGLIQFTDGTIAHASSLKDITDKGEVVAKHWKGQQHDVLVTTDETFKLRFALIKSEIDPQLIIWDECHWAYTHNAQRALDHFPEAVIIGWSATPNYLTTTAKVDYAPVTLDNGQVLYGAPERFARTYFPELLDERSVRWGIEQNYLASLAWGQLDFKLNLDDVPVVDGPGGMDFDQAELQRVMRENWDFIIQTIRNLYQSGQYELAKRFSAAICPGVAEAYAIAEALNGIGLDTACITNKTRDAERTKILERSNAGKVQFLSSVFALREGWDSPNAEVAMMLRPTKSRVLYMQFMGRVLRLFGRKVALVLDPHYQNSRFAPLSAPILFGTPGQTVYDGDILVGRQRSARSRKQISPYVLKRLKPVLTIEKIEIEYWAEKDGTFRVDGEVWGTIDALSRLLGISAKTIKARLSCCRKRDGRAPGGQASTFYAIKDVKKACKDVLRMTDQAGKNGTFKADGEVWATVRVLRRILRLSRDAIHSRLSSCRKREGKDRCGRPVIFYAIKDVKKACKDVLKMTDQAGKNGTFKADGEIWGTCPALSRLLGLSTSAIKSRLFSCLKREGKDSSGNLSTFYSISDMRNACKDLLKRTDQAGKSGMFKADGDMWASVSALAYYFGYAQNTIRFRLSSCRKREGKDLGGRPVTFYAIKDVKKACKDVQRRWRH